MEPWFRRVDGMDLLKDITSELRGDDERTGDEDGTSDSEGGERTGEDDVGRTENPATDARPEEQSAAAADDSGSGERDEHLCSFCETEFDASRSVCPECDAEIVVRGAR